MTAQKRSEPIEDVPISIALVSGARLESFHLDTLHAVTALEPSLDVAPNSASSKIYLRGIGSQGNAGMDQSVSTFIDGIYHGRSRHTGLALFDVDRIEVMRGPQGALHGMNSSAGAIAIHTRRPVLGDAHGHVAASASDHSGRDVTIVLNRPVTSELALRVVGDYARSDGPWEMVDAATGARTGAGGGRESEALRASLRWQPSGTASVVLKMERQRLDQTNPYAWQPGRCGNLYGLGLGSQAELDRFWTSTGATEASPLRVPETCSPAFADSRFDNRSPASPANTSTYRGDETSLEARWTLGTVELVSTTGVYDIDFQIGGNDLARHIGASRLLGA